MAQIHLIVYSSFPYSDSMLDDRCYVGQDKFSYAEFVKDMHEGHNYAPLPPEKNIHIFEGFEYE